VYLECIALALLKIGENNCFYSRNVLETKASADADAGRRTAKLTTSAEATADTGIDADETVLAGHSGEALSVVAATGAASASSIEASTESGPHCGGVVELRGKVERHGFNQNLRYA
jgi:hypothetical protein